jgi:RNA recognition motif-containing protein
VVDAKVPTDRETGRPRGFAFVELEDDDAAQRCIAQLNGHMLKGRPLRVNEAENRPPRPPGGMGGPRPSFDRPGGGGYRGGPSSNLLPPPPPDFGRPDFGGGRPPGTGDNPYDGERGGRARRSGGGSRRGLRRRKRGFE